ncbi:MAG: right-handed parallel beta-helix repeat-containing protein [Pirellulaceae bacterium]
MRIVNGLLITACLLVVAAQGVFPARGTDATSSQLPGARPAIDAAQYPSLQAAIDALPAEGGLVRLPAGEFAIDQPLVVRRGDVCLEGVGTATVIKNRNEAGQPAILLTHPEATDTRDRTKNLWRICLTNFRVIGNPKSGHGIQARLINEILIHGVTSSYHGGDGMRLDFCYEDARVSDSLITYNKKVGLNLQGCHDIVVSANQFEENQDALHCIDGFNLCMTGNCVDDHLGRGVVIENTYGSVVSGNMIEECQSTAIELGRDCYGIALSANVIAHNGAGIVLEDAHGCAVSANAFPLMKTDALRIGRNSGRIAVTGNSFSNSYIGEGAIKRGTDDIAAAGIVLDGTSDIGIAGNTLSGLTTPAVTVSGSAQRVLFTDNVLTDVESQHGKLGQPAERNAWQPKAAR